MIYDTVESFDTSMNPVVVGTSSAKIAPGKRGAIKGIEIKADDGNTGIVYLGNSNVATTEKGFPLKAGQSVFIPIDDADEIYAVASASAQNLWCIII